MSAGDYADFLSLRFLLGNELESLVEDQWTPIEDVFSIFQTLMRQSFAQYGYEVKTTFDKLASENVTWFAENRAFVSEGDAYTGIHLKLDIIKKNELIKSFLHNQDVSKRITVLGEDALKKALSKLANEAGWQADEQGNKTQSRAFYIPASDRVVTLSDNQRDLIEASTSEVIDALEGENAIDGDPVVRSIFLGEINATRELVRAQSTRVWLLYVTISSTLKTLIGLYSGKALGEAAKKLLDLLIEHVFGK